jgi:hypothetical protein
MDIHIPSRDKYVSGAISWDDVVTADSGSTKRAQARAAENRWASFHPGRNPALQFAPAGQQSGGFQKVSGRWIVIQREQKCKAIWLYVETMPTGGQWRCVVPGRHSDTRRFPCQEQFDNLLCAGTITLATLRVWNSRRQRISQS